MTSRTRVLVLLAAALAAGVVSILSLLRMLIPGFLDDLPVSLVGRLGHGVEHAVSLAAGLAVVAVAALALAAERSSAGRSGAATAPVRGIRLAALLAGALLALTTPGGVIPAAGYTFMLTVLAGIVVFVVLTVLRRPWLGLLLAAAVSGLAAWAVLGFEAGDLLPNILRAYGAVVPLASLAAAHVIGAAGLLVWTIADPRSARGRLAAFVRRHRVGITVIAAACALPYALVRATWLTPWPLFVGDAAVFDAEPSVRVLGLLLGLGMLTGGFLTLSLILPWGERFPRFLAGLGGRAVPVALAVIPAAAVAVLFTAAGIEFAIEGVGPGGPAPYLLLIFPFWLWGPLLGLATWGYAMRRRERAASLVLS